MKVSIQARNAQLDELTAQLNNGYLEIYSGTQPASVEDPENGVLLATLTFGGTAFNAASNGMADARAITEDANATGSEDEQAGWFRCRKSDGVTAVVDGTVGLSGSDLTLRSLTILPHYAVQVSSLRFRL